MRVATALAFERSIEAMNDRQSRLVRTQEELATGRKLLRPSDDPVAAAEAERARAQTRRTELQQRLNGYAKDFLGHAEATLGQVTDLMHAMRENLVQAGNGTLGADDRTKLATQLQGYRNELLALANRADGAGAFLFGGQGSRSAPFVDDGTSVSYVAPSGEQLVGVADLAPTTVDGRSAFMSVPTPAGMENLFDLVDGVLTVLGDTASTATAVGDAVKRGIDGLDAGLDRVLTARTEIGENLRVLDSRDELGQERIEQLTAKLSDLVYVDYAKAISDSANNQTALQAAMKTYSEISKLSLFQYV